jgi:hypothetical protein
MNSDFGLYYFLGTHKLGQVLSDDFWQPDRYTEQREQWGVSRTEQLKVGQAPTSSTIEPIHGVGPLKSERNKMALK